MHDRGRRECANSTLAKTAVALQRGSQRRPKMSSSRSPGGRPMRMLKLMFASVAAVALLRRERGAERRSREDPPVLGRPGHQLGLDHAGEEGSRAASRQVLHARAGALRRHAAHGHRARQRRARSRQPRLFHARHRDPERRHGRPAHHRRRVPRRRATATTRRNTWFWRTARSRRSKISRARW